MGQSFFILSRKGDFMPRKRNMIELQQVIFRLKLKQSIRSINRDTGIHRTIIRNLNKVANNSGWLSNDRSIPSENEIHQALVAFDLKKSSKSHG
jgi:hypothetical protein